MGLHGLTAAAGKEEKLVELAAAVTTKNNNNNHNKNRLYTGENKKKSINILNKIFNIIYINNKKYIFLNLN